MKARLLAKLLNTKRPISGESNKICIGSTMCHDIISVNKTSLKIRYALDTFHDGRKSLDRKEELGLIWDRLQELIDSGEIKDIIEGNDEVDNPVPVFWVGDDYEIKQGLTDKIGWPNTTLDGMMMYDNTHFATLEEAQKYALKDAEIALKWALERKEELEFKLAEEKQKIESAQKAIDKYSEILGREKS